jgi:hypothetical protein
MCDPHGCGKFKRGRCLQAVGLCIRNTNPLVAMNAGDLRRQLIASGPHTAPRDSSCLGQRPHGDVVTAFTPGRPAGLSEPGNWQKPCHRPNPCDRHDRHRRQNQRPARQLRLAILQVLPVDRVVTVARIASATEQRRSEAQREMSARNLSPPSRAAPWQALTAVPDVMALPVRLKVTERTPDHRGKGYSACTAEGPVAAKPDRAGRGLNQCLM